MDAQEVEAIILFQALVEFPKLPSDTLVNAGVPEMGTCNLLYSHSARPRGALFVANREGMNQWRIGETAVPGSPTRYRGRH
jgi:hypothetical protein